jgi:cytochrome c2
VVAYLADRSAEEGYPDPPRGDPAAGRRTLESVGCLACHRVDDEDKRGIDGLLHASFRAHGPNLEGTGSKLKPGWLYAWLRDPKAYWHDTRMPDLRLSDREAADVTAYLMTLRNEEFAAKPRPAIDGALRDAVVREYLVSQFPVKQADEKLQAMDERQKTLFLGERTIGRYGCFG